MEILPSADYQKLLIENKKLPEQLESRQIISASQEPMKNADIYDRNPANPTQLNDSCVEFVPDELIDRISES